MRKSIVITLIILLILVTAIMSGYYIYKVIEKQNNIMDKKEIATQEITDDCIDEYEEYVASELLKANASEEKITPNTVLLLKKQYSECNHVTKEYVELPIELVNMNEQQLKKECEEWEIEKFSSLEIILLKRETGFCNEHYIIRQKDGEVLVYSINEKGQEVLKEQTGIYIEYLPQTDVIKLEAGIKAYGKEELNSILEDFE